MKNRYTKLTVKLLLQVAAALLVAILTGLLVLYVVVDSGKFSEIYLYICELLHIEYWTAVHLYYKIFSDNELFVLTIGYGVLILVAVYWVIRGYTKYMRQIEEAIEAVFMENDALVTLPSELKPMEIKLNNIKYMLKQREFAAKEAQQQKSDLVVYLAHDLKTPLTSILGYSSLLTEEESLPPEKSRRYINIIYNKAKRMEFLLEELFEITRFNAQGIELFKQSLDLKVMLTQVVEEFYPLLLEKGLYFDVEMPEEKCVVVADGEQLARVFDNLLRNAVNYSEPDSPLRIKLSNEGQAVHIGFANYGVTIPPEKLGRIFEKFYRVDESRSSTNGGSGLGLAIAQKIIGQHGGRIIAQSANLWTTFTVILPKNDLTMTKAVTDGQLSIGK